MACTGPEGCMTSILALGINNDWLQGKLSLPRLPVEVAGRREFFTLALQASQHDL